MAEDFDTWLRLGSGMKVPGAPPCACNHTVSGQPPSEPQRRSRVQRRQETSLADYRTPPGRNYGNTLASVGGVGGISVWDVVFPGKALTDSSFLLREVNLLNNDVETFRAEVNARLATGNRGRSAPGGLAQLITFGSTKVPEFTGRWGAFWTSHQSILSNVGAGEDLAKLKAEFLALRSEWTVGLNQITSTRSPGGPSVPAWLWAVLLTIAGVAALVVLAPVAAPAMGGWLAKRGAVKAAGALL